MPTRRIAQFTKERVRNSTPTINEDEYEEYLKWQEQIELPTLDQELGEM